MSSNEDPVPTWRPLSANAGERKHMHSQKRTNGLLGLDIGDTTHFIIAGGESRSVLESFTQDEVNQMMAWLAKQQQSGHPLSIVNWPGWQATGTRMQLDIGRAGEITQALLARLAVSRRLLRNGE